MGRLAGTTVLVLLDSRGGGNAQPQPDELKVRGRYNDLEETPVSGNQSPWTTDRSKYSLALRSAPLQDSHDKARIEGQINSDRCHARRKGRDLLRVISDE